MHVNKFPQAFMNTFPHAPVFHQVMNNFHICLTEQNPPWSELAGEEGAICLDLMWMQLNTEDRKKTKKKKKKPQTLNSPVITFCN